MTKKRKNKEIKKAKHKFGQFVIPEDARLTMKNSHDGIVDGNGYAHYSTGYLFNRPRIVNEN